MKKRVEARWKKSEDKKVLQFSAPQQKKLYIFYTRLLKKKDQNKSALMKRSPIFFPA